MPMTCTVGTESFLERGRTGVVEIRPLVEGIYKAPHATEPSVVPWSFGDGPTPLWGGYISLRGGLLASFGQAGGEMLRAGWEKDCSIHLSIDFILQTRWDRDCLFIVCFCSYLHPHGELICN